MHLERAQRELVYAVTNHDRHLAPEQLLDLEPREAGHLDVEQEEGGARLLDRPDGFETVRALGDDFDVGERRQVLPQQQPRRRLVIHDRHAQRLGAVATSFGVSG